VTEEASEAGFGGALAGVRVVDLTRNLAGPFCTMVLGELGADVVKIESPRGDDTRAWAPLTDEGESPIFWSANRNKRSVAVDLDAPEGVAIVEELVRRSDVVVESFRPGALDRRGLGFEALSAVNARLIYASISAFGAVGPRSAEPGYDPVIQAATGIMSITGDRDGPPARLGVGAVDLGSGLWAVVGVLLALAQRERTGRGCRVDASLFETAAWWLSYHVAGFLATGIEPGRYGTASPAIAPYEAFETQEGTLFVAAGNDRLFRAFCDVLELAEVASQPRFETNALRVANVEDLRALLAERLRARPASDWEERLKARGVPCSRVASVGEFTRDPQVAALGLLVGVADSQHAVGTPLSVDGVRARPKLPPPRLGEHTDAVLAELGWPVDGIASLRARRVIG
jgi:crotonobetainyl-CoA:carnitine CoA-transferase CaiB-like acyl-CoA transferase